MVNREIPAPGALILASSSSMSGVGARCARPNPRGDGKATDESPGARNAPLHLDSSRRSIVAHQKGFTLIELIVVVTIIGVLASIAVVNVRNAQRKAAENVLAASLSNLRKAIDDFYADKQRYPSSLQELVDEKYMRKIPPDPITKSADTWIEIREEVDPEETSLDASNPTGPGVVDVKSGAMGQTLDDPPVPYSEL